MNLIVLSCQRATLLVEKSHAHPLSFMDKLQLRIHLKICDKCADYEKQSLLIENTLKANHHNFSNPSALKLANTSKVRIQQSIDEHLKK